MVPGSDTATRSPAPAPALGRELALTAKAVRAWADDAFARRGSSLATWILLQHAAASDRAPSQSELAGSMSIGGATLVRQVDRLEGDGLVRREPDPKDRRVTRILLTDAGKEHFDELAEIADEVDSQLRSLITDREERVFRSVLERLRAHTTSCPTPVRSTDSASRPRPAEPPAPVVGGDRSHRTTGTETTTPTTGETERA
jgi:MarR family transcriptional regulator for hemolysin